MQQLALEFQGWSITNRSQAFCRILNLPPSIATAFPKVLAGDQDSLAEAGNSVQRMPVHSVGLRSCFAILIRMDVERIIDDIEQMFEAPDIRPLSASDVSAANRRHDETLANSPWFRLWQDFGICCRPEDPMLSETERQ
jgi:hypothetical protein